MAGIDTLNPKHEAYIQDITNQLESNNFIVDNWGLEYTAKHIRTLGISYDFSLPALELRTGFDLLVSYPQERFYSEIDGKTTMFRNDTGNASIEVWPVLFGRKSKRPRLLVFQCADSYGLWLDQLDKTWFTMYFMPDRWNNSEAIGFRDNIIELLSDLVIKPYEKRIPWNHKKASGDPFFLWSILRIKSTGMFFLDAVKTRATPKIQNDKPQIFKVQQSKMQLK